MERTAVEKVRLGVLVILGTAIFVTAVYFIGNRQNLFGNTFTIHAFFKNVNGLQKGNNVRYSGIVIGTVNGIEMENDTTIRVNMLIEEKMKAHIKTDAVATIGSDGLVGSMIVNIVPGNGDAPQVSSGDQITSYSRIGAEDMLSTLNVTNENAALLTADLLKVTAALNNGEGTLGRLLKDPEMAKNLEQTVVNLKLASAKANATIMELNTLTANMDSETSVIGVLLADSVAARRMKSVLHNLDISSQKMASVTRQLDSTVADLSGKGGVIDYLAHDTVLVRRLERTMKSVEEGTHRFNENMEALKHNFLTRRYFKKKEREQKKAME